MSGHVDQAKQLLKPMLTPHATRSSKHTFNPLQSHNEVQNWDEFGTFWIILVLAVVICRLSCKSVNFRSDYKWSRGLCELVPRHRLKKADGSLDLFMSCLFSFPWYLWFSQMQKVWPGLMLLRRSVMWVSGFLASTHPCGSTHRCSHSPSFTYVRSNQCGKSWGTLIWVCTFFLSIFSFVHWEVRSTNDNFDPCDIKHDQTCADELRHYRYLL